MHFIIVVFRSVYQQISLASQSFLLAELSYAMCKAVQWAIVPATRLTV